LPTHNSKVKAEENDDGIYNELPYSTKTKYTEKKDPTNVKFSEK
jgi:hypothetical protein